MPVDHLLTAKSSLEARDTQRGRTGRWGDFGGEPGVLFAGSRGGWHPVGTRPRRRKAKFEQRL